MKKVFLSGLAALSISLAAGSASAELIYTTSGSAISRFDNNSLGSVTTVAVSGLQSGETLVDIDVRPQSPGTLYGIGNTSREYTINPVTGVATQVSTGQFSTVLNGTAFGADFNPTADLLRVVSNTEQNLRVSPINASVSNDTALSPVGNVVSVAYDRNAPTSAFTTLFGIDSVAGTLVRIGGIDGSPSPNLGAVTTIGSLGLGTSLNEAIGFDISGSSGIAFASITTSGVSKLYTVNLATGAATLASSNAGLIGGGTVPMLGLAAANAPEPGSVGLLMVAAGALAFRRRRAV